MAERRSSIGSFPFAELHASDLRIKPLGEGILAVVEQIVTNIGRGAGMEKKVAIALRKDLRWLRKRGGEVVNKDVAKTFESVLAHFCDDPLGGRVGYFDDGATLMRGSHVAHADEGVD
jgi:hypothetical protein